MKNNKQLRSGYTTGSCAAGASAAAAWMLEHQQEIDEVVIDTPKGITLTLKINNRYFDKNYAMCSITKDAGDDPDITHGIEVFSKVTYTDGQKVIIDGGIGVGRVTQEGLRIPKGHAAINPTPLEMIEKEVRKVIPYPQGISVMISIPEGERLAKKTFNPRLGIEGGLSILGTTGIVEPMSEDALKETIRVALNFYRVNGHTRIILVPGNIGEKMVKKIFLNNKIPTVIMSNYIGDALDYCLELGFQDIYIAGHIGKLIKPAGGIFNTHNRVSSTRMEILIAHLALLGMQVYDLKKIEACITTDQAVEIIDSSSYTEIYAILAEKAAANCRKYCFEQMNIEFALFDMKRLLGVSIEFEEKFYE